MILTFTILQVKPRLKTIPFFNYIKDFEIILHERAQNIQHCVREVNLAKNSYLEGCELNL